MTDLAAALFAHGYPAVDADRRRRGGGPTYSTRMLGRPAVVLGTEEGSRVFYDTTATEREGAVPAALAGLLFGRGAIHATDDEQHQERKRMFLRELPARGVAGCATEAGRVLDELVAEAGLRTIDLHDALVVAYGVAVLRWAGLSLPPTAEVRLARSYAKVVDGFGFAGTAYLRAWRARWRTDRWAREVIRAVRADVLPAPQGSVLRTTADADLTDHVAAVELGNVLRPTVATSWLGCFAVLAAHQHLPDHGWSGLSPAECRAFLHEVRRTAPFVPVLAARARRDLEVDGLTVREGQRLVLDVHGINRSPRLQGGDGADFDRERYVGAEPPRYSFLPQGGGPVTGHRCPGEDLVTALLAATLDVTTSRSLVPVGSWRVDLRRMPTLPGGGPRVHVASH